MDSHVPAHDPAHLWTFFRQWLRHPVSMASLSPSSPYLAAGMIAELPLGATRVIELGGGTGVFTSALLTHGIRADDLMVMELNAELHAHLQQLFPGVHVQHGDARELVRLSSECGFSACGPADAAISGLGMLSMPRSVQRDIVAATFECLRPDGRFIQFTYGPFAPIARDVMQALDLVARRGVFVFRNLPPATVYVFTRRQTSGAGLSETH